MQNSLARDVTALIFGVPVLFQLIVGLLAVAILRARNQRTLGRVIACEEPLRGLRRGAATLALLAVFGGVIAAGPDRRVLFFAVLLLLPALGLVWLGHGFGDALLGEHGVRRGWRSRRFEELEQWRLSGQHLRFRLDGEWTAVPCPPQAQAHVRAELERLNAGAESPFRD